VDNQLAKNVQGFRLEQVLYRMLKENSLSRTAS